MTPITSFTGPHRFLSNFWPVEIDFEDDSYPTVEHAYQAAKTIIPEERAWIRRAGTPGVAKRHGRKVTVRPNWDAVKTEVMTRLVRQKFHNDDLRDQLRATGAALLVEGNTWGDTFWGQSPLGVGENHLGKILMKVRAEL